MMFFFKKITSAILMPLPLMLFIAFLGLCFLWFTRRKYLASFLLTISFIGIFCSAYYPISHSLLKKLETPTVFQPNALQPVEYVVVLGSSNIENDNIPLASTLSYAAIERLLEGIRILNAYPKSTLILSGYTYAEEKQKSHALQMKKVAIALGVPEERIMTLTETKDTLSEAIATKDLVGDHPIALVTSGFHMTRALNDFQNQKINTIPVPTHFLAQGTIYEPWERYTPQGKYLTQTELYWHETLGALWQKLRLFANETP